MCSFYERSETYVSPIGKFLYIPRLAPARAACPTARIVTWTHWSQPQIIILLCSPEETGESGVKLIQFQESSYSLLPDPAVLCGNLCSGQGKETLGQCEAS